MPDGLVLTHGHGQVARLAGASLKDLGGELSIRYVKVAEYQARGVVHFHAVIRLDVDEAARLDAITKLNKLLGGTG